jgi:hypothetical protein
MTTFQTVDVLSTSTGVLLGDIGGVYKVVSFLVGRDVFTHELVTYGKQAAAAIKIAVPSVPTKDDAGHVNGTNFAEFRDEWIGRIGTTIELPDSLRDCLANDRNALSTLRDLVPDDKIVIIND